MFLKSRLPGSHRQNGASPQLGTRNAGNTNNTTNNANNNNSATNHSSSNNNNSATNEKDNGKGKKAEEPTEGPDEPLQFTKYDPIQISMDGVPVFGSSLKDLVKHDSGIIEHLKVPLFFRQAVKHIISHGLGQEGILKHAGSGPEVQEYRERVNRGDFDFTGIQDIYTVGSVLKAFLRELPEPLLTTKLFSKWIAIPGKAF